MKKIVIKLEIHSDRCRNKALKTVAQAQGVVSMSLEGDQLVVTGDVDSVCLTTVLRKKFPYASLQSVEDLNTNVEAPAVVPEPEVQPNSEAENLPICYPNYHYHPSSCYQVVVYDPYPNTCSIL
ncbi:hypothetical protein L6164_031506 [Bauhinia variegata]|uniref:Uncharacterized protein n=1 Tax=Bauhinia variegata TaxID=167791 RepID=A0ACB9LH43_BAUVA|nr:hypothetical protein L6164_031506 [Bauhinia variegata]